MRWCSPSGSAADQGRVKRWTSTGFYRLLSAIGDTQITADSADFRLVARPVLEALARCVSIIASFEAWWPGPATDRRPPYAERARIGGQAKYSLRGRARLAADATFSFSLLPLRIALLVGLCFLVLAAAEALYVVSFWLTGRQHQLVPGWASLMFMVLIVGAALMFGSGSSASTSATSFRR